MLTAKQVLQTIGGFGGGFKTSKNRGGNGKFKYLKDQSLNGLKNAGANALSDFENTTHYP